jgi:predicted membrane chloride channel (bestrophin family)
MLPLAIANELDSVIRGLAQDLNSCMRIFFTPMPFAYIVHLRCPARAVACSIFG